MLQEGYSLVHTPLVAANQGKVVQALSVFGVKFQRPLEFRLGLFLCAPINERGAQIGMRAGVLGSERQGIAKNMFGFLGFAHLQQ